MTTMQTVMQTPRKSANRRGASAMTSALPKRFASNVIFNSWGEP